MKKTIFTILIFVLSLAYCLCQTEEGDKKTDPSLLESDFDPHLIEQFQDSGQFKNGLKVAEWVEYSIDSSMVGESFDVSIVGTKTSMSFDPHIQKETGEYLNGKRHGSWTTYRLLGIEKPFMWIRDKVTTYEKGLKNGPETQYLGLYEEDQVPSFVQNWKNGVEEGLIKIYDAHSPFNLQYVYNVKDGETWFVKEYYPNGSLKLEYTDTIVGTKELQYLQSYYENGILEQTGYFIDGEKYYGEWRNYYENGKLESVSNYSNDDLNGNYKYYHKNGELWTEREYKNGMVWNVYSNYDSSGQQRPAGTLKNGTGTIIVYDEEDNLIKTIEYVNGKEKE
jgi:antitoxin component YwqK of YwqJK toxin-antitoxin module